MCKLCNTDRNPVKPRKYSEFACTAYDYIGEYPCSHCRRSYNGIIKLRKDCTVDKIILERLHRKYFVEKIQKYGTKHYSEVRKANTVFATIAPGIVKVHNTITGNISYVATAYNLERKASVRLGVYSTAQEAILVAIVHLQNINNTQSLNNITKFLKGLENETSK